MKVESAVLPPLTKIAAMPDYTVASATSPLLQLCKEQLHQKRLASASRCIYEQIAAFTPINCVHNLLICSSLIMGHFWLIVINITCKFFLVVAGPL